MSSNTLDVLLDIRQTMIESGWPKTRYKYPSLDAEFAIAIMNCDISDLKRLHTMMPTIISINIKISNSNVTSFKRVSSL